MSDDVQGEAIRGEGVDADAGDRRDEGVSDGGRPDQHSADGLEHGDAEGDGHADAADQGDAAPLGAHDPDPEAGPELVPELVHRGPHRKPTAREVEEHNVTHTPAKSWCSTCVASKATDDPHRRRRPEETDDAAQQEIAKVYFDYGFFRNRVGSGQVPFIVATCKRTGLKKAFVCQDRTGAMPGTVRSV